MGKSMDFAKWVDIVQGKLKGFHITGWCFCSDSSGIDIEITVEGSGGFFEVLPWNHDTDIFCQTVLDVYLNNLLDEYNACARRMNALNNLMLQIVEKES